MSYLGLHSGQKAQVELKREQGKPLPGVWHMFCPTAASTAQQGLTLAHFSAQLERFLWDRGCI